MAISISCLDSSHHLGNGNKLLAKKIQNKARNAIIVSSAELYPSIQLIMKWNEYLYCVLRDPWSCAALFEFEHPCRLANCVFQGVSCRGQLIGMYPLNFWQQNWSQTRRLQPQGRPEQRKKSSGNESFSRPPGDRWGCDRISAPVSERIFRYQEFTSSRNELTWGCWAKEGVIVWLMAAPFLLLRSRSVWWNDQRVNHPVFDDDGLAFTYGNFFQRLLDYQACSEDAVPSEGYWCRQHVSCGCLGMRLIHVWSQVSVALKP